MILYIHGFASSSYSTKKLLLDQHYDDTIITMDLACEPLEAIRELKTLIEQYKDENLMLVGSSLGGFYALHLTQTFDLPVVLINPSMRPFETLARFSDSEVANYSMEKSCFFKADYVKQLKAINITPRDQKKVLLLLQTADENLDYKVALSLLPEAEPIVQEGGSHAFEDFPTVMPAMKAFYTKKFKL